MLETFYNTIDAIIIKNIELTLRLRLLRDVLKSSLSQEQFQLSCIQSILEKMHDDSASCNLHDMTQLFYHDKLHYSVRLIFWPAFYGNQPHKHKTWSVTGVLHRDLEVNIYDKADTDTTLKCNRVIQTRAGETGYLLPGCIHSLHNPTNEVAISIHIFNHHHKHSHSRDNAVWFHTAQQQPDLSKTPGAYHLINRFYDKPSVLVKWMAVKSLYEWNPTYSKECLEKLSMILQ